MYRTHKIIIAAVFFAVLFAIGAGGMLWKFTPKISAELLGNFTTFLAIVIGFYIASISALYGSARLSALWEEDTMAHGQRLVHTLQKYFTAAVTWAIVTLVALFGFTLFDVTNGAVGKVIGAILIALVAVNLCFLWFIAKTLIAGLYTESKAMQKEQK